MLSACVKIAWCYQQSLLYKKCELYLDKFETATLHEDRIMHVWKFLLRTFQVASITIELFAIVLLQFISPNFFLR